MNLKRTGILKGQDSQDRERRKCICAVAENAKEHTRSENSATGTGRSRERFISETFKFILKDTRLQTQRLKESHKTAFFKTCPTRVVQLGVKRNVFHSLSLRQSWDHLPFFKKGFFYLPVEVRAWGK